MTIIKDILGNIMTIIKGMLGDIMIIIKVILGDRGVRGGNSIS